MVPQAFGRGVLARAAYQYYKRVVLKQIKGHGTSRKPQEHVRSDLKRHLDAVAALVNPGPFLLGEKPFLCDFAVAGQLVFLGRTPVGGGLLAEQPAIDAQLNRLKQLRKKRVGRWCPEIHKFPPYADEEPSILDWTAHCTGALGSCRGRLSTPTLVNEQKHWPVGRT